MNPSNTDFVSLILKSGIIDQEINEAFVAPEALEDLYKLVPSEQITDSLKLVIKAYYTTKGHEYIRNSIEYVNKQKPKNYLAYLKSTLENHYSEILETEKENEEQRIIDKQRRERIDGINSKIKELTYKRDVEIEKTAKSIFDSLPEKVKEQITQLAKSSILKESPKEDINSTDHIFKARLEIYILEMVKSLYEDKFKDIHEKYDKSIGELESEIKSN